MSLEGSKPPIENDLAYRREEDRLNRANGTRRGNFMRRSGSWGSGPGTIHEYNFDRPGKAYRETAGGDWWACDLACDQAAQCKAWTWTAPGVRGTNTMCSLKNEVPAKVAKDKAISGVKGVTAQKN